MASFVVACVDLQKEKTEAGGCLRISNKLFGSLKLTIFLLHVNLLWSQLIVTLENTGAYRGKKTASLHCGQDLSGG